MAGELYIPIRSFPVSEPTVWQWFGNVCGEMTSESIQPLEKTYFEEYYREAGLLRWWRRGFFRHHYALALARAVNYIFEDKREPVILDLGCGFGTQSLLFAALGARVVSLDLDERSLAIFRVRRERYESMIGGALNIEIRCGNAVSMDYSKMGPFDAIFSMFAFNMMQPSQVLMDRLAAGLGETGRIVILDGNVDAWVNHLLPSRRRRAWSPQEMAVALTRNRFKIDYHRGGYAIPPMCWCAAPRRAIELVDGVLVRSFALSVSHQIMAKRRAFPT